MNPEEEITFFPEDQRDYTVAAADTKPSLGVTVSKKLWEEKTVTASEEFLHDLASMPMQKLPDWLKDGHIVFLSPEWGETHQQAYRVNRMKGVDLPFDFQLLLEPCDGRRKEIVITWTGDEEKSNPEVVWHSNKSTNSGSLFVHPTPDITVLQELEAYSLATTMKL